MISLSMSARVSNSSCDMEITCQGSNLLTIDGAVLLPVAGRAAWTGIVQDMVSTSPDTDIVVQLFEFPCRTIETTVSVSADHILHG